VLFLTKGEPTKHVWYYEHPLPHNYKAYNKSKPMRIAEFDVEKAWWEKREENEQAWKVPVEGIIERNYNLDIKNPNSPTESYSDPVELLAAYADVVKRVSALQLKLKVSLKESIGE
jgi:type I restriction enzyme M protein